MFKRCGFANLVERDHAAARVQLSEQSKREAASAAARAAEQCRQAEAELAKAISRAQAVGFEIRRQSGE